MSVLVVAGGMTDRAAFLSLGSHDVTITNIDDPGSQEDYTPYRWDHQDAEALTYPDEAFDWVVVNDGLHHCRSPHGALLELYRVARRGVLALESRDSALMRLAVRAGVSAEYELQAVAAHSFEAGGVRNTAVPNYVYRWTEREVQKTIASQSPHSRHRFVWFHELEMHLSIFEVWGGRQRRRVGRALRALEPAARAVARVLPSQTNRFAFAILKPQLPRDLQPWLRATEHGPAPDEAWIRGHLGS